MLQITSQDVLIYSIADNLSIQKEICKQAKKCNDSAKDMHATSCVQF